MKNVNNKKIIGITIIWIIIILLFTISIATENSTKELSVSYCAHIQDNGWEKSFSKYDGELSGTSGQSKRLEAIKIKTDNLEINSGIKYRVHIQDIGWQAWKQNGEIAGTSGRGLRLEAIKIELINNPDYTVEYRVHVQNIGWQEWKQDGAIAGTEGKGLRLEAIQIRIIKKENKGEINVETDLSNESYFDKIQVQGWKVTNVENTKLKVIVDNKDITKSTNIKYQSRVDLKEKINYGNETENAKPGFSFSLNVAELNPGKHELILNLVTDDETAILATCSKQFKTDKDIHIFYQSHVQNIGWQNTVRDGNISGTTGKSYRIEAMNIKAYNLPEDVKLKYQAYVQDIGWQDWVSEGQNIGTVGKSKRIEALKIKLENEEEYSIEYKVHIQGLGWQNWKQDGAMAGTTGKNLRIEAVQIRIVKKEKKGAITVESNISGKTFYEEISIKGWKMTNVEDAKLKVFLDDKDITSKANIEYKKRSELEEKIDYGSEIENKTPGFNILINTDDIKTGNYTLSLKLYTLEKNIVLATYSENIIIDKEVHIKYQSHVQKIGWQNFVMDGKMSGTTGKSYRIEAMNIKAHNLPEGVTIKYQVHVQDIGWQNWKNNGEIAGTTGKSKSIEGIKIKLENTDKYSIIYRAHVEDYGWQDWTFDGEMAGTVGIEKRIEAIEIKIVDKITEDKTKVYLDKLSSNLTNEVHVVSGYLMTRVQNKTLKLLIDDEEVKTTITRAVNQEIYNTVKGYGGEELNPAPKFYSNIDFSKYSLGTHIITVQAVSENGDVVQQASRTINLVEKIKYSTGTYGISGLLASGNSRGSSLKYYKYGSGPNVFFATFCVHGFEDNWANDGFELVDIANQFWDRLKASNDYELAKKWTIYIIPTVNPDGVSYGWTNNGPGRTTLYSSAPSNKGIDLNRSWSVDFQYVNTNRNYTGTEPFQAYEARYLRDFLLANKSTNGQTILVDLHGWTQQLIGDSEIRNYYRQQFPENTDTETYGKGYLINWARVNLGSSSHTAKSALIELPRNNYSHGDVVNNNLANRYIEATLSMLKGII